MPSAEIRRHWDRVAELGCIITHRPNPTLHHAHGGSMTQIIGLKGGGRKTNDWLVIPLNWKFHTGYNGIHTIGIKTWESRYGKQEALLDQVSIQLGYNVWKRAGVNREIIVSVPFDAVVIP